MLTYRLDKGAAQPLYVQLYRSIRRDIESGQYERHVNRQRTHFRTVQNALVKALNDLADLSRLSAVLETCAKFNVRNLDDFERRLSTLQRRRNEDSEGYRRLVEARSYATEKGFMRRDSSRKADERMAPPPFLGQGA